MDALRLLMYHLNAMDTDNLFYSVIVEILRNIKRIPHMSIYEVSDVCFVSPSSISRLMKFLGFKSFTAFKIAVASVVGDENTQQNSGVSNKIDPESYLKEYFAIMTNTFREVQEEFDSKIMQDAANAVAKANKIGLFFTGNAAVYEFQQNLFLNGKYALIKRSLQEERDYVSVLQPEDLIIVQIHNENELSHKFPIIQAAHQKGIKVITICSFKLNKHTDIIDFIFTFRSTATIADNFFLALYLQIISILYKANI